MPADQQDLSALNRLFPVFIKLEEMHVLLVGGGYVGLEKLTAIVQNAPAAKVTIIAKEVSQAVRELAAPYSSISIHERPFESSDLNTVDIVIVAVNDREVSKDIRAQAKAQRLLVNVADTPDLCDFYLGSIVQKGSIKIAISTNGKSPTLAKRLREMFQEVLPATVNDLAENLQQIRSKLAGNFTDKVEKLNHITSMLIQKEKDERS